jgi:hypothetical protein
VDSVTQSPNRIALSKMEIIARDSGTIVPERNTCRSSVFGWLIGESIAG